MNSKLSILVVDDEQRFVDEIEEFLKNKKFKVLSANHPVKALELVKEYMPDIAILDIRLPGMTGLELLHEIKKIKPLTEVIMISGHGDMNTVIEAMRKGAIDYFAKPFRLADVYKAIIRTQRFIQINSELKAVKSNMDILSKKLLDNIGVRLVGNSLATKEMIRMMTKVAQTPNTSVLVLGESGTGKELVAHGIHYLSSRSNKMFYSVNCSAIPETLFESEFFGHKKGAFTGAETDKEGWFEIADGGTLFLDEISDMPLVQQAKLLRVLEERKVSKIGSRQSKQVDVRVIAASNTDLEKLANENKFRLDLFHRLNIFVINIPSLRTRKEDIPALCDYYLKMYARLFGKSSLLLNKEAMEKMMDYSFPGNVRELRNIIERAVILCEGDELLPHHLQLSHSHGDGKDGAVMFEASGISSDIPSDFGLDLEENERQLIRKALSRSGNNKSKAASLLNITWQALDRRMKKYNME
ncbi:Response regulator of zinc sigma-54-dependent two-component system [hydrothermal vent metagenome]|uniref:Response regulator of zinc sigma-54-dependent two-component system n=1 Tax=hydrothermal vent metagenome TaxID=652676 RepID=A0A3B0UGG1_9ZZZZ